MNNKEVIKKIKKELDNIEQDEDVDIRFESNVVEEQYSSFANGDFAIMKNVIEIISRRPIKIKDSDLYGGKF